jgi:hypothetical protein
MRLPRVRCSVRQLMVAVALTSFLLGGVLTVRRYARRAQAANYATMERLMRQEIEVIRKGNRDMVSEPGSYLRTVEEEADTNGTKRIVNRTAEMI